MGNVMLKAVTAFATALVLLTVTASGQVLIGDLPPDTRFYAVPPVGGTRTILNLGAPALQAGTLTDAVVKWNAPNGPCTNAFRLRFFRPGSTGYSLVADRGPFSTTTTPLVKVTLSPPVEIQRDDVMGVFMPGPQTCGGIWGSYLQTGAWISVDSDYPGGALDGASFGTGDVYAMRASAGPNPLLGILPVVGSVQGSFGSTFRTVFRVTNPNPDAEQSIKFVFRRAGQSPVSSDPWVHMLMPPATTDQRDLLAAGNITGLGSFDIYGEGGTMPQVTAHIFNEGGNAGTNGFIEPMIPVRSALRNGERTDLVFPADLNNFRMNVGVRSLGAAIISVIVYDVRGQALTGSRTLSYAPDFFIQMSLQQFLDTTGVTAIPPSGKAVITVTGGAVILYSTLTDNRTNDSAMTLLTAR